MDDVYFTHIAECQRRAAASATNDRERAHHELEAERFEELAGMNPEDARRAYRPTRAYEPAAG